MRSALQRIPIHANKFLLIDITFTLYHLTFFLSFKEDLFTFYFEHVNGQIEPF